MSEIKPGNMIGAETLAIARGNVRALDIVIGLMAKRYPRDLIPKFIRECVELKQEDLLRTTAMDGLAFLAETLGSETYEMLVNYLAEQAARDLEMEETPEVELVYDPSIEKEYREEQDKKEAAVRKAAAAKKQAGGKTATVRKAATAAKKTAARKATGKKSSGAADGK